jgi:hypothetical protein
MKTPVNYCKQLNFNIMESTRVISFRIPYSEYQKIILECEAMGITTTEFIERKMAAADKVYKFKRSITSNLKFASVYIDYKPESAKEILNQTIDKVNNF